jgi:hypothetical protein
MSHQPRPLAGLAVGLPLSLILWYLLYRLFTG